jgi:hypothetical protein
MREHLMKKEKYPILEFDDAHVAKIGHHFPIKTGRI